TYDAIIQDIVPDQRILFRRQALPPAASQNRPALS
ncbi:MAG: hypothetical protein QOJ15_10103, partial [Bradyrhizobium sp.]|nr:hypothetical protein [Bradyrhizobium sp.]